MTELKAVSLLNTSLEFSSRVVPNITFSYSGRSWTWRDLGTQSRLELYLSELVFGIWITEL